METPKRVTPAIFSSPDESKSFYFGQVALAQQSLFPGADPGIDLGKDSQGLIGGQNGEPQEIPVG